MRALRSIRRSRAHVGERVLTGIGAAALVVLLTLSGLTAPLDRGLFDRLAGARHAQGEQQVVVVAIDAPSVSQLGPWPWSRRELANLVDRLTAAGTRAIGLDLLLAQPSLYDPEGDALLTQAIRRNGAVVLPVMADLPAPPQPATALLPAPSLAEAAAALGHVEVSTDPDGMPRQLDLHAGLGTPRWPAFSLVLESLATHGTALPARHARHRAVATSDARPETWSGTETVLLAYPRGGGIEHVPAAGVLDGRIGAERLAGRVAIVGRTDDAPVGEVTVPGMAHQLAPVDIQANAVARLLEDRAIWPIPILAQVSLAVVLVCLPLLLLGLPGMHTLWVPMGLAVALVGLLCWALLLAGAWFPPMAALLVLMIGVVTGVVSSWLRMRRQSRLDPGTGTANRAWFDTRLERDVRTARRRGRPLSLLLVEARGPGPQLPGQRGELALPLAAALRLRLRRPGDLIARLDAGRFAALLPDTGADTATALATALMVDLEGRPGRPGPAARGNGLRMGLATLHAEDARGSDLLLRATRDLVAARDPLAP